MELFKRRPLASMCAVSLILMLLSLCFSYKTVRIALTVLAVIAIAIVIATAVSFALKNKRAFKKLCCILIFLLIALPLTNGANNWFSLKLDDIQNITVDKVCYVEGEILKVGYKQPYKERYYVKMTEINGKKVDANAVIEFEGTTELETGDLFAMRGKGEVFSEYEKYLISDGYLAKIVSENVDAVAIKGTADKSVRAFFIYLNEKFSDVIYDHTSEDGGALVNALVLGNRDQISDSTARDFRRSGVSHALALSGLHMTIVMGFFDFLLIKARLDRKIRCVMLIGVALFYLALTGFSLSAARATVMLGSVYLSYLFHEESDSITALLCSAVIILMISPKSLFDISLWMSFFATLGIVVISEIISPLGYKIKKKKIYVQILYKLLVSVSITLAAVFFVMMFSLVCFGEVSLISPLTNLIVTPLITALIIMGIILVFVSFIPIIPVAIGFVINVLCKMLLFILEHISRLKGIVVSLKYDFAAYIIVAMSIALALFLIVKIKRKWTIALIPTTAVLCFAACLIMHNHANRNLTKVTYIKDSTSETLVLTTTEGATVCDISTGGYRHISNGCIAATDRNATEIENIILTHYHTYHINSLQRICDGYIVRNVYLPSPENENELDTYNKIVKVLKSTGVTAVTYRRGYQIEIGSGRYVNVSEEYIIKRSTHPMFFISVITDNSLGREELLYYSSPIFENPSADHPTLPNVAIIGLHGPRIHNPPNIDRADHPDIKAILLADGEKMISDNRILARLGLLKDKGVDIQIDRSEYEFILGK